MAPRDSHAVLRGPLGPSRPGGPAREPGRRRRVPELVPIRYGRMLVSPFTFFRGAALVMASDLSGTPRSGLNAQICGDAHLSNFGVFGSPERQLVFDCNDFDETLPGPWEWDVKRLAASIVVAARGRGFSKSVRNESILALGLAYRQSMRQMAAQSNLEVWYSHIDGRVGPGPAQGGGADDQGQGRGSTWRPPSTRWWPRRAPRTARRALDKLTTVVDGERRIVSDPPLIVPLEELFPGLESDFMIDEVPRAVAQVPGHAAHRPQAPARAVPGDPDRPQGGRGGQRRHPLLDHSARGAPRPGTCSSSRPRRRRRRSSSASPRRAPTPTTAPASWPASA